MAIEDPLIQINLRAMEYIWSQVSKEKKNKVEYCVYNKGDIPYLYYSGLVDTQRYSLEVWEKAFEDCLGEDGRYWVSHEKMIWLGRYRYSHVVQDPFDPLKMRIGKYSVDRLWQVYERSIIPSTSLPSDFIKNIFNQVLRQKKNYKQIYAKEMAKLKKEGKDSELEKIPDVNFLDEGGKEYVIINRDTLVNLKNLLDKYPSPRRKLEASVYESRMAKLQQLSDIATKPQKSSFEAGADFRETTKKSLKDMLVKASEKSAGGRKPTEEVINLKELQKKKKPTKF